MARPGRVKRSEETVAQLVRRARNARLSVQDQQEAFGQLIERFQQMALVTAAVCSSDSDTAKDICQEALVSAWRKLPSLRDPSAFGGWLKRLVRTQSARARRHARAIESVAPAKSDAIETLATIADEIVLHERDSLLRRVLRRLPADEREAVERFYFRGDSLRELSRHLGISTAKAGKLIYNGRLRLRRLLPPSITEVFLVDRPSLAFTCAVRAGVMDEYVGTYLFRERPNHPVTVRREGDFLVSYAGGQRNVLASRRPGRLRTTEFDGEGRFARDRRGRISHFVYYEFGRRLGVAHKVSRSS